MRLSLLSRHIAVALGAISASTAVLAAPAAKQPSAIASVEFVGMAAPSTAEQKASAYSDAKMVVRHKNGRSSEHALQYHQLFATGDKVGNNVVGGIFDAKGQPITDNDGQMAYDAPDGTSLMQIPGLKATGTGNPLAVVHQYEYKSLPPNDGVSKGEFWSKLPAGMSLTLLNQDKANGKLQPVSYQNIDFSGVNGSWINCGSTLSGWNTHVGSEEYEPDAKIYGGGNLAKGTDDTTDMPSFSQYYFGDHTKANPYHYGLVPEVTVHANGTASVVKHYAPGRFAREMQMGADDNKTFIGGDDGKNTGLFMFVADRAKDLSAGTVYAARATQTSAEHAGNYTLQWIKLGHGTNAQIKTYVDQGIKFADMFDVAEEDPKDATYKKVDTYNGLEWLRLKTSNRLGMSAEQIRQAAAFLETRRYGAMHGATTEFSKMEYIAYNTRDKKFYIVISRVEAGMTDKEGDIRVTRNDGGAILEMNAIAAQKDSSGTAIASSRVGTTLRSIPALMGGWNGGKKDDDGNQCEQDKICGPDNIVYNDAMRTLFIGEDTSRRNNNYVWAYNIDTQKLSRILSVPMGAEATGLSFATRNGHSYIMSNFQHPGEFGKGDRNWKDIEPLLKSKWGGLKKAAMGYLGTRDGALPAIQ
ncbi:MAG: alkaline phosphatase [Brachymonas sp.]|nr:alkaline phosphatase [Brachymonas sp.]